MQAVIDASYFIEFTSSPFEKKFQWILSQKLVTTTLFAYEVHNVLLKSIKIAPEDLHKFHELINELDISFKDIGKHELEIYKLSLEHKLSFYDASYLWLSLESNKIPIATYEKAIIQAASVLEINIIL